MSARDLVGLARAGHCANSSYGALRRWQNEVERNLRFRAFSFCLAACARRMSLCFPFLDEGRGRTMTAMTREVGAAEGVACFVATRKLLTEGKVAAEERVVIFNTGQGSNIWIATTRIKRRKIFLAL